jgi:hypothetical protein
LAREKREQISNPDSRPERYFGMRRHVAAFQKRGNVRALQKHNGHTLKLLFNFAGCGDA